MREGGRKGGSGRRVEEERDREKKAIRQIATSHFRTTNPATQGSGYLHFLSTLGKPRPWALAIILWDLTAVRMGGGWLASLSLLSSLC